jgi:hypothetical protein
LKLIKLKSSCSCSSLYRCNLILFSYVCHKLSACKCDTSVKNFLLPLLREKFICFGAIWVGVSSLSVARIYGAVQKVITAAWGTEKLNFLYDKIPLSGFMSNDSISNARDLWFWDKKTREGHWFFKKIWNFLNFSF